VPNAAHRELAARHGELERLQKEQRELTDFLVHDMRAPLTTISCCTESSRTCWRTQSVMHRRAGVEVTLAHEHGAALVVCNDGPAIPETERERIFEKLARCPSSGGSAGLGLYFCKRAMQAQCGDIQLVDVPDSPTAFRVWLPPVYSRAEISG
jgi:signal transduction histidine kinase